MSLHAMATSAKICDSGCNLAAVRRLRPSFALASGALSASRAVLGTTAILAGTLSAARLRRCRLLATVDAQLADRSPQPLVRTHLEKR